jgi:hypothetical protein
VARDHDVEAGGARVEVDRLADVAHVQPEAADLELGRLGKLAQWWGGVDVAAHRADRRDAFQLGQDLGPADVARMDDQLDLPQGGQRLGAHEPVRVRDQPDDHSLSHRVHDRKRS